MRAFEFRLERVLKWKQQRERLAELRVQEAQTRVQAAQRQAEELKEKLTLCSADLSKRDQVEQHGSTWLSRYQYAQRLTQELEAAELGIVEAKRQLQEARRRHADIATEVAAILQLRETHWREHVRERDRRVQDQLDELGLRRWMMSHGDGTPRSSS